MGWRGAGGNGAASTGNEKHSAREGPKPLLRCGIGAFFFFGCLLMILGSVGEWIVGNTFPFVVFGSFGKPPLEALSIRV